MEHEVREATVALADALAHGNAGEAAALYDDDGRLLTPAAELITGRRQIEAYWRAGIDCGLAGVELQPLDLQLGCGIAIEIGRYALTLDVAGRPPVADRGKYLALHRRQADGSWRRVVDVFNPDLTELTEVTRPHRKEEQ